MSDGKIGESLAEYYFRSIGWKLFRHQPRTVIARKGGRPFTIQCRSDGVPDFTGYEMVQVGPQLLPIYRACEVKEAHGSSMPASRVRPDQRRWLRDCNPVSAFVMVVWMDGRQPTPELFRPIEKGSYKRGEGLNNAGQQR